MAISMEAYRKVLHKQIRDGTLTEKTARSYISCMENLCEHLKALSESSLPVTRYYHWCFVDNFEWLEGFTARFGLVHFDTATHARTIKKSGEFYSRMIAEHGVTEEMAAEVEKEVYPNG